MSKREASVETMSIIQMPINHPQKEVFCYVRTDRSLIDATCRYADKLREQDVEIFERRGNVLATDKGYFAILFEEEVRSQPGNIDNPIPFKGSDGRMKVEIVKENGDKVIVDLAELVAKQFVPNLHLRKKVGFKNNNRADCNANNLIFLTRLKYWWYNLTRYKTITDEHK